MHNDEVLLTEGCGKTGSAHPTLHPQRDRSKGGGNVHLFSLPCHTVPWLLDKRNNICRVDSYEEGLASFRALHKSWHG